VRVAAVMEWTDNDQIQLFIASPCLLQFHDIVLLQQIDKKTEVPPTVYGETVSKLAVKEKQQQFSSINRSGGNAKLRRCC